jgi:hypothetical protein
MDEIIGFSEAGAELEQKLERRKLKRIIVRRTLAMSLSDSSWTKLEIIGARTISKRR